MKSLVLKIILSTSLLSVLGFSGAQAEEKFSMICFGIAGPGLIEQPGEYGFALVLEQRDTEVYSGSAFMPNEEGMMTSTDEKINFEARRFRGLSPTYFSMDPWDAYDELTSDDAPTFVNLDNAKGKVGSKTFGLFWGENGDNHFKWKNSKPGRSFYSSLEDEHFETFLKCHARSKADESSAPSKSDKGGGVRSSSLRLGPIRVIHSGEEVTSGS